MWTHSDKMDSHSEEEAESCRAISGSLFNSLPRNIMVTAGVNSCSCACHFLIYRDGESTIAFRSANFTHEACKLQKIGVAIFEVNSLKLCLSYIVEEVKPMKITVDGLEMYSTAKEGQKIWRYHQPMYTGPSMSFRGMLLYAPSHFPISTSIPLLAMYFNVLSVPACISSAPFKSVGSRVMALENGRKRKEAMWSSLPVLVLWMIKDKLDIFGNFHVAAVCHDWRSASACYPRRTFSCVGDGMPWIWHTNGSSRSSSREVISVLRKSKLAMDRPEFADTTVVSSKQGWILLLKKRSRLPKRGVPPRLFLVNLFTRNRIELPDLVCETDLCGSFATNSDGSPRRVFLFVREHVSTVIIKTACPGDEAWTCQSYSGMGPRSVSASNLISIGDRVYYLDALSRVTVFDVANRSCKQLPRLASYGFIAEHGGELVYVERKFSKVTFESSGRDEYYVDYDYSCFAVYKHKDASWERLEKNALMGTSWFLCPYGACITAKGDGLKVYGLRQILSSKKRRFSRRFSRDHVVVNDLVTGAVEILPISFPVLNRLEWVAIG